MLIFLPQKTGANPKHLEAAGLGSLLREGDNPPLCADLPEAGPGKKPGQLWGWIDDAAKVQTEPLLYQPQRQTWLEGHGGRYWVGWSHDNPPAPLSLQRTSLVDGPQVQLANGQAWQIISAANLPKQARLMDGQWQWAPAERFRTFVDRSVWAFDLAKAVLSHGGIISLDVVAYVLEVLSWNYRIVPEIADHLGLFTPDSLLAVTAWSTDIDRLLNIEADLKKADPAAIRSG